MRSRFLTGLLGLLIVFAAYPAQAQWKSYVNKEVGFSFLMPGTLTSGKGTYETATGERPATVYTATDDNIVYRVNVADTGGQDGAQAIKDAAEAFQSGHKVLTDNEARVEGQIGRKAAVDLAGNNGRSLTSIYFKNGHLIQLIVTVLPANGDYGTPDAGRFVESIAFGDERYEADATVLTLQK
jgi:hypothetical protein